jgi:hypothetical protein
VVFSGATGDPVEAWKSHVFAMIARGEEGRTGRSSSIHLTLGFLVLAFGLGLPDRRGGSALTLAILTSAMLTHELPRAAYSCEESVRPSVARTTTIL